MPLSWLRAQAPRIPNRVNGFRVRILFARLECSPDPSEGGAVLDADDREDEKGLARDVGEHEQERKSAPPIPATQPKPVASTAMVPSANP